MVDIGVAPSDAVRVGFEDYLAARGESLLRLAALLAADPAAAEGLLVPVLLRARRGWRRSGDEDPDTRVRLRLAAHVARRGPVEPASCPALLSRADQMRWGRWAALSRRQRVVLVLRYGEDLDDGRIGEAAGLAPRRVAVEGGAGLALLGIDEDDADRELPAWFAAVAGEFAVDAVRPALDGQRAGARAARRHRAALVGSVVGAAALLAAVVVPGLVYTDRSVPPPVLLDPSAQSIGVPAQTVSYRGVTLLVPATWTRVAVGSCHPGPTVRVGVGADPPLCSGYIHGPGVVVSPHPLEGAATGRDTVDDTRVEVGARVLTTDPGSGAPTTAAQEVAIPAVGVDVRVTTTDPALLQRILTTLQVDRTVRTVGLGGLQVDVPKAWPVQRSSCGEAAGRSGVYLPAAASTCGDTVDTAATIVTLDDRPAVIDSYTGGYAAELHPGEVDGAAALTARVVREVTVPQGFTGQGRVVVALVAFPAAHLLLTVRTADPAAATRILASVRLGS